MSARSNSRSTLDSESGQIPVHCATDWEDYAYWMLEVLAAEPALQNTAEGFAPRPDYRPLTKFENRGLRLGHGVWDLVFRRRACAHNGKDKDTG